MTGQGKINERRAWTNERSFQAVKVEVRWSK